MRCSVHEKCTASGHVKIESVQLNSKLANVFWQSQLKYVDLSHKIVIYTNTQIARRHALLWLFVHKRTALVMERT
jgi:hypothetical protein